VRHLHLTTLETAPRCRTAAEATRRGDVKDVAPRHRTLVEDGDIGFMSIFLVLATMLDWERRMERLPCAHLGRRGASSARGGALDWE
jgi:hypothetical protein